MYNIILTLYIVFIIEWIMLICANSIRYKQPNIIHNLWKKCITYIIITAVTSSLILFCKELLVVIPVLGLLEIIKVYFIKKNNPISILIISIFIYTVLSILFCCLIFSINSFDIIKIYMLVIIFDSNSQLLGMLLGRHKIIQTISPNKTTEGAIGGLISGILSYCILYSFNCEVVLYAILISLTSFCGDMLASIYKRKIGIKDFSSILPAHGGFLDRFDSFIAAGAIGYLVFNI